MQQHRVENHYRSVVHTHYRDIILLHSVQLYSRPLPSWFQANQPTPIPVPLIIAASELILIHPGGGGCHLSNDALADVLGALENLAA